jgi:hypothetical protein
VNQAGRDRNFRGESVNVTMPAAANALDNGVSPVLIRQITVSLLLTT